MVIESEIVNGTTIIVEQAQDSIIQIILAMSTLGLAIITGVGLWRTLKRTIESNEELKRSNELTRQQLDETRKSNTLLTLELKTKFKPKIDFTQPLLRHNYTDINNVNFSCNIVVGNVSLSNMLIYDYEDTTKITLHKLLTKESEIIKKEHKVGSTLEPSRYHDLSLPIKIDTKQDIWIAIWLNYEYLNGIKEEGIAIFYFNTPKTTGGFESMGSTGFEWFNDNDIKNARNEFLQNKGATSGGF